MSHQHIQVDAVCTYVSIHVSVYRHVAVYLYGNTWSRTSANEALSHVVRHVGTKRPFSCAPIGGVALYYSFVCVSCDWFLFAFVTVTHQAGCLYTDLCVLCSSAW